MASGGRVVAVVSCSVTETLVKVGIQHYNFAIPCPPLSCIAVALRKGFSYVTVPE